MRQRHYITFYRLRWRYAIPFFEDYGLMCTRSWWGCFKFGLKHICQRSALFFRIENATSNQTSHFY